MQGTLDDLSLPEVIQLLSLSQKTGAIEVEASDNAGTGRIYFTQGRVVGAALGDLPPLEAFYAVFAFPGGSFRFLDNVAPPPGPPIAFANERLLLEGLRRADEWHALRRWLPATVVPALVADPGPAIRQPINLQPDEWRVLTLINGRDALGAIAQRAGLGEMVTTTIVARLFQAGLVTVQAPAPPPPVAPPPAAAATPAAPVLPAAEPIGARLYARLEAAAAQDLGPIGRRVLDEAYRRLRLPAGADLDPATAGRLCDQFEQDAALLLGPGRARALTETLRRAAADLYA